MIDEKDAIELLNDIEVDEGGNIRPLRSWYPGIDKAYVQSVEMATNALKNQSTVANVEPFTDAEKRIFSAAMSKEETYCKEIDKVCKGGLTNVELLSVCHSIEEKVKKVLWS